MASRRSKWKISKIAYSAKKNIEALDLNSQKTLINHLNKLVETLLRKGIKKVEGKKNIYRGRMGGIRYYFRIISETKSIEILMVESRG